MREHALEGDDMCDGDVRTYAPVTRTKPDGGATIWADAEEIIAMMTASLMVVKRRWYCLGGVALRRDRAVENEGCVCVSCVTRGGDVLRWVV